jgi:hypothetical protein
VSGEPSIYPLYSDRILKQYYVDFGYCKSRTMRYEKDVMAYLKAVVANNIDLAGKHIVMHDFKTHENERIPIELFIFMHKL